MNKLLKKFLATGFATAFVFSCGIGMVSAKESDLQTVSVPRWGAWSNFSSNVKKDGTGNAQFYLNTSPHAFPLYGQMYRSTATEKSQKVLNSDRQLSLRTYVSGSYKAGAAVDGAYYKAAICSSNYEPDVRTVTYKFKP